MPKILIIGAAGGVASVCTDRLLHAVPDLRLTPADLDPRRVRPTSERATAVSLDLFDPEALGCLMDGHDLVLHGAGPYLRTGPPVARACLERRIPYVDFADDIEAYQAMVPLHEPAREAGVSLWMGCGVSPGLTNPAGS